MQYFFVNDWSAGLDITGWRDRTLYSVKLFNLQVFINRDIFCLPKIDSIGSAPKRMYSLLLQFFHEVLGSA